MRDIEKQIADNALPGESYDQTIKRLVAEREASEAATLERRGQDFVREYKELCRKHKCEMACDHGECHANYVAVYDPSLEVEVFDLGFGEGWIDHATVYRLAELAE